MLELGDYLITFSDITLNFIDYLMHGLKNIKNIWMNVVPNSLLYILRPSNCLTYCDLIALLNVAIPVYRNSLIETLFIHDDNAASKTMNNKRRGEFVYFDYYAMRIILLSSNVHDFTVAKNHRKFSTIRTSTGWQISYFLLILTHF